MSIAVEPERDAQLLPLAASGNVASLAELYERHRDGAMAVAISVLADVADAEDVVQDVFIRLPQMARTYDPDRGGPAQWLLRSVRNRAIDHLRRRSRQLHRIAPRTDEQTDLLEVIAAAGTSPSDQVEADEFLDLLERLDARYAQLIRLAFVEGFSHSAIAGITGLPLGTVKSRIRVGLRLVRSLVADVDVTPRVGRPHGRTTTGPLLVISADAGFGRRMQVLADGLAPVDVRPDLPARLHATPVGIIVDARTAPAGTRAVATRLSALGWRDTPAFAWGGRWRVRPLGVTEADGPSALGRVLRGSPSAAVSALLSTASDPMVHGKAIDRLLTTDGLAILRGDRLGRVTAASRGASLLFGRAQRELIGASVTELSAMPRGWTERQWQRLVGDGWWTGSGFVRGTTGSPLPTGSVAWLVPSGGFLSAVVALEP
jgi:RNA polymerase sigma-70 factor (ECF subfamily)